MIPGVEVLWFLLAFLTVGFPVMVEVWKSIRQKDIFNEFSLMLLATIGAFCIGEYPEGVAVMLFYSSCNNPSSGIRSPGFTMIISPTSTSPGKTDCSFPCRKTKAFSGRTSNKRLIFLLARSTARWIVTGRKGWQWPGPLPLWGPYPRPARQKDRETGNRLHLKYAQY